MFFKLYFKNQTHIYNKAIQFNKLKQFTRKVFNDIPNQFVFIYQALNGQMTYIQSDADLIGLKYCCSAANDFMIKLVILKSGLTEKKNDEIETKTTIKQVKENMSKMYEKVIDDLKNQENTKAVKQYLSQTYTNVCYAIEKEEKIATEQISNYLDTLYEITSRKLAEEQSRIILTPKPQSKRIVRFSPEKPKISSLNYISTHENSFDQIISEKVLDLIPSLVDKIYTQMEQKLKNKCMNCMKRQRNVDEIIAKEIRRRMEADMECYNPEQ